MTSAAPASPAPGPATRPALTRPSRGTSGSLRPLS